MSLDLAADNARLRERVRELEAQVAFLTRHQTLAAGIKGEKLIASHIGGLLTAYAAGHDVTTADGLRIEVKYSGLSRPDVRSPTTRWQWAKLLGESGAKAYDYVVLVGEADPRWREHYRDPAGAFVLFCLPFAEVLGVSSVGQRNSYRSILLGTNPVGVKKPESRRLYQEFAVTERELAERFGL